MKRVLRSLVTCVLGAGLLLGPSFTSDASAHSSKRHVKRHGLVAQGRLSRHPRSGYYRGRTEVRGFRLRIGGYSYSYEDGALNYRDDGQLDSFAELGQSPSGPFDSGFFFDSGIGGTRGGGPLSDAPYPN